MNESEGNVTLPGLREKLRALVTKHMSLSRGRVVIGESILWFVVIFVVAWAPLSGFFAGLLAFDDSGWYEQGRVNAFFQQRFTSPYMAMSSVTEKVPIQGDERVVFHMPAYFSEVAGEYQIQVGTCLVLPFILIVAYFIFGDLPLTLLFRVSLERAGAAKVEESFSAEDISGNEITGGSESAAAIGKVLSLLRDQAMESKITSHRFLTRSNVHLFVGVIFGAIGVTVFVFWIPADFWQIDFSGQKEGTSQNLGSQIAWRFVILLPKVGVLLLIEALAGFFLRNYRTAMEEYRYFEKIHRKSEANVVAFLIAVAENGTDKFKSYRDQLLNSDLDGVLKAGETTTILETIKSSQNDLANLGERILETIQKVGKPG